MRTDAASTSRPSGRCRGSALVEWLIGLALGLFLVATGLAILASHLHESSALVLETRLMQDLRGASELISRDLRRAGHWGRATAGTWREDEAPRPNPYQTELPASVASDRLEFAYSRDAVENDQVDPPERSGFRLRQQAIEVQLGAGNWQALTDPSIVGISRLRLTPRHRELALPGLCTRPCPPPGPDAIDCPPRLQLRDYELEITARSPLDPALQRSLRTRVRIRNDAVLGDCPQ